MVHHTTHCPAPMQLTGCHIVPLITWYFPPNPYLGKQIISLGVASILTMRLSPHTYNPGHNILELSNILVQIRFTTSKRKLDI